MTLAENSEVISKSQLAYCACWFACMKSLTLRYNLIIQNFATSQVC